MHYDYGHLVGYHGMSYIKSNLPKVAIWRSNGFRISPHIAKKSTTLLFRGTFGHNVCQQEVLAILNGPPVIEYSMEQVSHTRQMNEQILVVISNVLMISALS